MKLDFDALRKRRLFFCAPLYGNVMQYGFHVSVSKLGLMCAKNGIHAGEKYVGCDSLVPRARNRLAHLFLDTDCTDLLFVDSDIQFEPEDALSLLQLEEDIVGGIYSRKQVDWGRIKRAVNVGIPPERLPPFGTVPVLNWLGPVEGIAIDRLFEVKHMGTGFLRIRRPVFERMIEFYGESIQFDYHSDEPHFGGRVGYDFFRAGVDQRYPIGSGKRQYLSEDWAFCERARECGFKIWAAPWVKLTHSGVYDYVNDFRVFDHDALLVPEEDPSRGVMMP